MRTPIAAVSANCRDCYRCIAVCPVRAPGVRNHSISIDAQTCIACGQCVRECPKGLLRVRNDVDRVATLLRGQRRVVLSLAPSWVSEFPDTTKNSFYNALQLLGFREVSNQAIGAQMLAQHATTAIEQHEYPVAFLPACPAVTEWILRSYPHYAPWVLPALSPLRAHAEFLRNALGSDIAVVAITPCTASKLEADLFPEEIEAVITFGELHGWLLDRGINPQSLHLENSLKTVPSIAPMGGYRYPVAGELLQEIKTYLPPNQQFDSLAYSGFNSIRGVLDGLERYGKTEQKIIIELMACEGGCVNSPTASHSRSLALRQLSILESYPPARAENLFLYKGSLPSIQTHYDEKSDQSCQVFPQSLIAEKLQLIGHATRRDTTDCSCCGFSSCNEFARALCQGKAEPSMCVSFERESAQSKFELIFNHMPSGVLLVDAQMNIIEVNWNLAHLLGPEVELLYDKNPGLTGLPAERHIPFHRDVAAVLRGGEPIINRDEKIEGRMLRISIFAIESQQIACAIARDMYASDVRGDEIVRKTEALIAKNLATVQKIAYLLGENAAETEGALNAILESFANEKNANA